MGEGAGIVVLEEREHAIRRNARIYCEVSGYGLSCDAYHITAPHPLGEGAQDSMRRALEIAQIEPEQVDYVNAHATSTPVGDIIEAKAIASVLGRVRVSSTKGATGHLLGAAGAVEAIYTMLGVYHDILPPTANLIQIDPEAQCVEHITCTKDYQHVERRAGGKGIRYAMSNSFGFGGTNATLLFNKHVT
jgi:3-oxoacyl-[acyl-carrier-protein] synthase II